MGACEFDLFSLKFSVFVLAKPWLHGKILIALLMLIPYQLFCAGISRANVLKKCRSFSNKLDVSCLVGS